MNYRVVLGGAIIPSMKTNQLGSVRAIIIIITGLLIIAGGIYFVAGGYSHETSNGPKEKIVLPAFSDYSVQVSSASNLPTIDLNSHALGSQFKTKISEANKVSPNFAGKFSIVTWGCGAGCQTGVIIDRSTGKIISNLPFILQNGYEAKIDSSLLVVNPHNSLDTKGQEIHPLTTYYLNWNGKSFDQIGAYTITNDSIEVSTSTVPKQL